MEWHTVRKINMRRRIGLGIVALLFLSLFSQILFLQSLKNLI